MTRKKLVFALLVLTSLFAGCASGDAVGTSGNSRCDRNGDYEERTACNR